MPDTYSFETDLGGMLAQTPTTEDFYAANPPKEMSVGCAFAIYNHHTSSKVVKVKALNFRPYFPCVSGSGQSEPMGLWRTSAQSGGRPLRLYKYNSAAATLSSLLEVRYLPSVTTTEVIRKGTGIHPPSSGSAVNLVPKIGLGKGARCSSARLFDARDSAIQKHVLREGQGIALLLDPVATYSAQRFSVIVTIIFAVGSEVYYVTQPVFPFHNGLNVATPFFGIFNQSGSGVVAEVLAVDVSPTGVGASAGNISEFSIDEVSHADGGIDVSVVKHDSLSPDLPSAVKVWTSAAVGMIRGDSVFHSRLADYEDNRLRKSVYGYVQLEANGGLDLLGARQFGQSVIRARSPHFDDLVLRPGRGVAIFQRTSSVSLNQDCHAVVDGILTVEDIPSSGGESGTGSRFNRGLN